MKTFYFLLNFILCGSIMNCQYNTNFTTFEMTAPIEDSQIVSAEIAGAMDSNENIHFAWIKTENGNKNVMYSVFNSASKTFQTFQVENEANIHLKVAPFLLLDSNNNPHITYMIKRVDSNTKSGNYAVMYAKDDNGDGVFETAQVSTNPTDPTDNSENQFDCYVNGRPNLFYLNGQLMINYTSYKNSLNGYENQMIFAEVNGLSFTHSIQYEIAGSGGVADSYEIERGINVAHTLDNDKYMAITDVSGKKPGLIYNNSAGNWQYIYVSGYETNYSNKDYQIYMDSSGSHHFMWFHNSSSLGKKFCRTMVNDGYFGFVEEVAITNEPTGVIFPATFDNTLLRAVYWYEKSYSDGGYMVVKNNTGWEEIFIDNIEEPLGKRSLFANNGNIYFITADTAANKIYVTTNTSNLNVEDISEKNNDNFIYPNPVVDYIYLDIKDYEQCDIYNLEGKIIKSNIANYDKLDLSDLKSGVYVIQLMKKDGEVISQKFIKK